MVRLESHWLRAHISHSPCDIFIKRPINLYTTVRVLPSVGEIYSLDNCSDRIYSVVGGRRKNVFFAHFHFSPTEHSIHTLRIGLSRVNRFPHQSNRSHNREMRKRWSHQRCVVFILYAATAETFSRRVLEHNDILFNRIQS